MKIKRVFVAVFILLILGLSVYLLFNKIRQTEQRKEGYNFIPDFQLQDIYGNRITNSSLKGDIIAMFLFFNPDCDLCRDEMIQIKENKAALSQGEIIFFSILPADSILQFLQAIDFEPASNMIFISDEKVTLVRKMEANTTPTIYIYRQGKLVKRFNGPVKIETLIHYFTKEKQ